jgi:hypothetical protein
LRPYVLVSGAFAAAAVICNRRQYFVQGEEMASRLIAVTD